jgi:uncharacterized membrane protein
MVEAADSSLVDLATAGAMLASGALAGGGIVWLRARSREGRKIVDQIEGFREYLSVADEDRLNAVNQPKKTPELFERFLPYAIALGCQNAWAEHFSGVLAAAGVEEAGGASGDAWYVGSRDFGGDPVSFSHYLGSSFANMLSASSAAAGSGSGGGGSSGGGGGGGGGGGW